MTVDVERSLERRRLRRRLGIWRIAAIVLGALALLALSLLGSGGRGPGFAQGSHIARITVSGLITDDRRQLELLKSVTANKDVAAVLLSIDSPGGTTTGGEALYEAVLRLGKEKPVVAVCGTMATSAAYMTALATDRIFARGNTITGSVGVIFQFPEVSVALDKLGIKMHEIKSGQLKASPSMFQPLDEPGRQLAEEIVRESQVWFLSLVTERRKITTATVPGLEAGRIYSGRQALSHGLVDAIGSEKEAVEWLEANRSLAKDLRVIDWAPQDQGPFGLLGSRSNFLEWLLGSDAGRPVWLSEAQQLWDRLVLDGLVSVWHGRSES